VTYRSSTIVGGLATTGLCLLMAIVAACSGPAPAPHPSASPAAVPAAPVAPAGEEVPAPPPPVSAPAPVEDQPAATAPAEAPAGPQGEGTAAASPSPAGSPASGDAPATPDPAEAQRAAAAEQLKQKLKAAKTRVEALDASLKQNCPDLKPGELRHPGAVRACIQLQAQATQAAADYEDLKKQAQAAGVSE
jgi:hypothetical protein